MNKQTQEALKMAIEALLYGTDHTNAVKACKEALKQPAQEYLELEKALKHCDGKDCECFASYQGECACDADWTPEEVVKLRYQLNNTHPHQWQGLTEDEIVAKVFENDELLARILYLDGVSKALKQALKEKNRGN
jgi:hypothetical protein